MARGDLRASSLAPDFTSLNIACRPKAGQITKDAARKIGLIPGYAKLPVRAIYDPRQEWQNHKWLVGLLSRRPLKMEKMMLRARKTRIGSWLNALLNDESGQSVAEYAVVMAVITLVALVSISTMGAQTLNVLRHVGTNLQ